MSGFDNGMFVLSLTHDQQAMMTSLFYDCFLFVCLVFNFRFITDNTLSISAYLLSQKEVS